MHKPTSRRQLASQGKTAAARPVTALAAAGVRPAKSRGQNFLVSPSVADRIVAAADLSPSDDVIEIGPGLGILTERIVISPIRGVTLIELDSRLAERLAEKFAWDAAVRVVNEDFLHADLNEIAGGAPVKVIGNLPFNSAAAMLHKLCGHSRSIARMVLMFQREVAARIRARPNCESYGALSVFTALYWEIDLHFVVAAGSFHPRPKVDAEVIRFRPRTTQLYAPDEEPAVLATVRAAFSAPRKTIRNALAVATGLDAGKISAALGRAGIDPSVRAETLEPARFVALARAFGGAVGTRDA
ncbi:MAG TPA: 16S rRNA (adenine(1518)-N(6)/adenine(1519)-N(6))-dimethyltransferase RsmA [Candidatus Binataceae bacterium]|nr:16S rRNA (adenine(1518)-N(6)/adenine(1519)-N(6))-dimethyltransferase RsmA [Candidatus Binataceae bacterium]